MKFNHLSQLNMDSCLSFHDLINLWLNKYLHQILKDNSDFISYLEKSWIQFQNHEIHQLAIPLSDHKIIVLFVCCSRLSFNDSSPFPFLYEILIDIKELTKFEVKLFKFISNEIKAICFFDSYLKSLISSNILYLTVFPDSYAEINIHAFLQNKNLCLKIENKKKDLILDCRLILSESKDTNRPHLNSSLEDTVASYCLKSSFSHEIPDLINDAVAKILHQKKQMHLHNFTELELDPKTMITNSSSHQKDYNSGHLIVKNSNHRSTYDSIVIGIQTHDFGLGFPIRRLLIIDNRDQSVPAAISDVECTKINAAIHYAFKEEIPIDWFPISFGVKISYEEGIENLDASASTAREIVKYASDQGVPINIVVNAANIGAQAYWNALAAIIQQSSGILIMTEKGSMTLTGHRALVCALHRNLHSLDIPNYSDKIFPNGLQSLGGYENIYGPNSEAMLKAIDLQEACYYLMLHHYYSYTQKRGKIAVTRSLNLKKKKKFKSHQTGIEKIKKEIALLQAGFNINREIILDYLQDADAPPPLRYWNNSKDLENKLSAMPQIATAIVQEMSIGNQPMMVIFPPIGPLTPMDSFIIARAIYKANHRLPVLIIGTLTGFNSDPVAMKNLQLYFGSSIIKSIVHYVGPLIIINLGCLIGGCFVIFSKQLNPFIRILALEGSRIQVVGSQIATKVVFHSKILKKAEKIIQNLGTQFLVQTVKNQQLLITNDPSFKAHKMNDLNEENQKKDQLLRQTIEQLEFQESLTYEQIHTIERALKVKAIDEIIQVDDLKEAITQHCKEVLKQNFLQ